MGKFNGKTLLMLGSNIGATDIINYAKANGAYTIAADYYPTERSAAKRCADLALQISTNSLDELSRVIEEHHVNGVLAGISEFNLLNAMELSRRHHLPFYCTRAQWDMIESKDQFRRLCEENGVPCPKTYFIGKEPDADVFRIIRYPAVLKPVDACASAGVHICRSEDDLKQHISDAQSCSRKGDVIIEEFVTGNEFTAHYVISNGKAALACVDNRYPAFLHSGEVTSIPIARIYPSIYVQNYLQKADAAVRKLAESIGMQEGILFVQGIHNPESREIRIFEAGLRCAGEAPYRFLSAVTGENFIRILADHALLGSSDYDVNVEKPELDGKCCGIVSFAGKHGTVGSITGLDETVAKLPDVLEYESRYPVGREVPDTDTLRQLMIRFVILSESRAAMEQTVRTLNEQIQVLNTEGEDMTVKFDPARLWNEF